MAIDLNVNKYGAQFSAFVDFAKKATDENTVVCADGPVRRPLRQGF